jgi:HK97 family phage prohead protease
MKNKSYKAEIMDVAEKGIVTIAISRFGVEDMGQDVVHKGAFTKTFKEGGDRIKHYLDHTIKQGMTVGLPTKMYESEKYAIVESALNLEKSISRDLFSDYKFFKEHGKSLEHSFGYETIKGNPRKDYGEDIFELKLYEYSTVGIAMNPDTPLLDMKSADGFTVEQLESYLRKFDVSNQRGKEIESIIKAIKELKEPVNTTSKDNEPSMSTLKELSELLRTKKIY